jgi:hypothetical protein
MSVSRAERKKSTQGNGGKLPARGKERAPTLPRGSPPSLQRGERERGGGKRGEGCWHKLHQINLQSQGLQLQNLAKVGEEMRTLAHTHFCSTGSCCMPENEWQ